MPRGRAGDAQTTTTDGYKDMTRLIEGRLFLKKVDDVRNNYQAWGGLRIGL